MFILVVEASVFRNVGALLLKLKASANFDASKYLNCVTIYAYLLEKHSA